MPTATATPTPEEIKTLSASLIDTAELNRSIGKCDSMAEEMRRMAREMRGENMDRDVAESLRPVGGIV